MEPDFTLAALVQGATSSFAALEDRVAELKVKSDLQAQLEKCAASLIGKLKAFRQKATGVQPAPSASVLIPNVEPQPKHQLRLVGARRGPAPGAVESEERKRCAGMLLSLLQKSFPDGEIDESPLFSPILARPQERKLRDPASFPEEETWWQEKIKLVNKAVEGELSAILGDAPFPDPPPPQPLLFVPAEINGTVQRALIDSGASDSFLSAEVVEKLSLKTYPLRQPLTVKVANGQTLNVTKFVRVKITIGNMPVRLFLRVIATPITGVGLSFSSKIHP